MGNASMLTFLVFHMEWTGRWTDGWVDGWVDGRWMDGPVGGSSRWVDGRMGRWTDGWMVDGRLDGRVGRMGGWVDGRVDGSMGWSLLTPNDSEAQFEGEHFVAMSVPLCHGSMSLDLAFTSPTTSVEDLRRQLTNNAKSQRSRRLLGMKQEPGHGRVRSSHNPDC